MSFSSDCGVASDITESDSKIPLSEVESRHRRIELTPPVCRPPWAAHDPTRGTLAW